MLKYLNTEVTFAEIPDEITLCINITGCPCHCPGCHSQFLWKDVGVELSTDALKGLILRNEGISCICFMGGDQDPATINALANFLRMLVHTDHIQVPKIAWYSGKPDLSTEISLANFDYIKIGPYIEKYGGLNDPDTNQKLFKVNHTNSSDNANYLEDITYKFWKK